MKKDFHPTYYAAITVTCACGNTFVTGSTVEAIHTEICSACHPFFTGKAKIIAAGQVDKFKARLEKAQKFKTPAKRAHKPTRAEKVVTLSKSDPSVTEETDEKSDKR